MSLPLLRPARTVLEGKFKTLSAQNAHKKSSLRLRSSLPSILKEEEGHRHNQQPGGKA